ncbi:NAD(P)/FAD-dependent oxidoreductase [Candidatus Cryosericum terrychapinii]|nr:FAD-dependent oxidoreductase [Candidatus Cryosericum terrychapinii]
MKHVIIGASVAGITAAARIKKLSPEQEVIVLSGEGVQPYGKMSLPYMLSGMTWFANCTLPSVDGVDVMLNKYVDGVDTVSKTVHTNDGEQFEYDRLLIATGTSPFIPDIPGARLPSVVGVRNIGDIEVIRKRIAESTQKRVILAGAGLVNAEIGDALVKLGIPVTYVISSDRVLSQIVDREASAIIEQSFAGLDVELLKGEDIQEIEEKDGALEVKLASGKVLSGSCVVYGKGVRPNTGFLKGTDVRLNKGVVLGRYLETSVPGIYGAGDAVETDDILLGEKTLHALWPVAVEQANNAAGNMLGMEMPYGGDVLRNILMVFGQTIFTGGISTHDEGDVYRNVSDGEYGKIVVKDGRLRGFVFVGEGVNNPGVYLRIMRDQTDISTMINPVLNGTISHVDLYPSVFKVAL